MADGSKSTRESVRQRWIQEILHKTRSRSSAASSSGIQAAGGNSTASISPTSLFARPYCSKMPAESTAEAIIQNAFKWQKEDAPKIQILAMNAGHSFAHPERADLVRPLKPNGNLNSVILCVSGTRSSVLLTGDAEEGTWDQLLAFAAQYYAPRQLATTYVVVSHHGSGKKGATPVVLLREIFKPSSLICSVGKFKTHKHPDHAVLKALLTLPSLAYVDRHDFNYFVVTKDQETEKVSFRRKECDKAIFSTLNQGSITIDLDQEQEDRCLTVTMDPLHIYEAVLAGRSSPVLMTEKYTGAYLLKEGVALKDLIQELRERFHQDGVNVRFWIKETKLETAHWKLQAWKPTSQSGVKKLPPHLKRFSSVQHVLINEQKRKFRFLEVASPEVINATASASTSTSAAAAAAPPA